MAAFMKGDRVAVIDPVLPFCIKSGRISDISIRLGTMNEIVWEKGDTNEKV